MNKGRIRKANNGDYEGVWIIFQEVIQKGDTYVFDAKTKKKDLKKHWFSPEMETYVFEKDGKVLGTYILKPNQIGLGDHIANASYMVAAAAQGMGIGRRLCIHSLDLARDLGFLGMQFNLVVSTNRAAVKLWEKFGFEIIGITPDGFRHKTLGLVDSYIMFKKL